MKVIFGRRRAERRSVFSAALAEQVGLIEECAAASVAVVIRGCSGNYRDVAYLFGAVLAWIGLLLALFLPHELHPNWIPFDLLIIFAVGAWLGGRTRLRIWLTTWRRRRRQVRTAARAAFIDEGLLHARADRGLLIYWSVLERRIEVVAGDGLIAVVPAEAWHAMVFALRGVPRRPHPAAALLECLGELRALLSRHFPAVEKPRGLPFVPPEVVR
jgi:putative membrane protein